MKPEIKQTWIEALESGKYEQTKHQLRDDVGYCCLGVLCEVVDPNGWLGDMYMHKENCDYENLPITLSKEVGLHSDDEQELIKMNDNGKTFKEIAEYIRGEALKLEIVEPPHVFDMIIYSLRNPKDSAYHESIVSSINSRFAKQRATFLKEFFWYYNPTKVGFLSEGNTLVFEWLKSIGVKFT